MPIREGARPTGSASYIRDVLNGPREPDLHGERASSPCDAPVGVLRSGWLAMSAIGHGLAAKALISHRSHRSSGLTAVDWVHAGGRARALRNADITADRYRVAAVVCVQDPAMKQAWCLATSGTDAGAKQLTG